ARVPRFHPSYPSLVLRGGPGRAPGPPLGGVVGFPCGGGLPVSL
ncbi:MAG: hypothetical protein AVDCRST_MAG03-1959, partial [uncultured Rubrobacteraceae bacterium]